MDVRLQHPYTCLIAGPTSCGKTQFVKKLIEQGEYMTNGSAEKICGSMENINQLTLHYQNNFLTFHLLKEFQKI